MQALSVRVIPGAARNAVEPQGNDSFKVYVTASAQKGKANKSMLKLLSKHLGVSMSHLIISTGDRSNNKTVLVLEQ